MSSLFYYEPFSDFDRLFDEAFNARTGNNNNGQRQRQIGTTSGIIPPRYVTLTLRLTVAMYS